MHPSLKNERPIKLFPNGVQLSYAHGKKDDWCVYCYSTNMSPYALHDAEYFQSLKDLADKYETDYVYSDFVLIYDRTSQQIDQSILSDIDIIADTRYHDDATSAAILFSILYMAMVAEYHYVNWRGLPSRLNKRIKRLGVYQILYEGYCIEDAANYSRGRSYNTLNTLCNQYGF